MISNIERLSKKVVYYYLDYILYNKSKFRFYFFLNKLAKKLKCNLKGFKLDRDKIYRLYLKDRSLVKRYDPSIKSLKEINYLPGVKALLCHRLTNSLYKSNYKLLSRVIQERVREITLIDINPGASIGSIMIDHGVGVVIGETSTIEDGVVIYQGVTLGATKPLSQTGLRHPFIKKNSIIYSGSTILGSKSIIEEGSIIKANSLIIDGKVISNLH